MLAAANFADLVAHELAGLRAGGFAGALVPLSSFDGSLVRHHDTPVHCYLATRRAPEDLAPHSHAQRARETFDPSEFTWAVALPKHPPWPRSQSKRNVAALSMRAPRQASATRRLSARTAAPPPSKSSAAIEEQPFSA